MFKRLWLRQGLALAGWTFLGLFFASQTYLTYRYTGGGASGRLILEFSLVQWYLWAILAAFIVRFTRRFPIEQPYLKYRIPLHVFGSLIVDVLKLGIDTAVGHQVFGLPRPVGASLHLNFLTYWTIVGVTQGVDYYKKYRDRELRASQLEGLLAQSRLQALRGQLHPHFLFNTLQAISTLLHKDAGAADHMLIQLSHLLRISLDNTNLQRVPLAQELDFLKMYLAIEQVRLQERLEVRQEITNDTVHALVPYLILLPLVENAIRHGIAPRARGGEVCIRSRRQDHILVLEVEDDGVGLSGDPCMGIGLGNTKDRLEQLYASACRFEMVKGASGGVLVRAAIPFETAGKEAPAEMTIEDTCIDFR